MSTRTEERREASPEPEPRQEAASDTGLSLNRLLAWRPRATPETLIYLAIFAVAFGLRFWDLGDRAIHHDESLHATYSWYLFKGRGYEHHPLMHGPFLFHAMALVYLLFGVSDATARFVPAAFGAGMVLLPLLLRPWLGRAGAVAAAALIALSPSILYFSRFVGAGAQDIVVAVAMLLMVAGIWQYLRSEHNRWLYVIAGGLALAFTTKEVTYMLAAILVLYLNGAAAADFAVQRARDTGANAARRRLTTAALMPVAWLLVLFWPWLPAGLKRKARVHELPRAAGPLIVIGTLAAPMFAAGSQVLLRKIGVDMAAPSPLSDWTNEKMWGAITIGALIGLGAYFGTAWRAKRWLIAAAVFWAISIPLFTTFFTNPDGIASGIWGSLDYWLEQQDVQRGNQPVFYYLFLTPVYEYLALALALGGIVYRAVRTGWDTAIAALAAVLACLVGAIVADGAHLTLPFVVTALLAATYASRGHAFQQFLVFWTGAILLGLSAAGEKMPWLEVHIALPLALLAALTVNEAWQALAHASHRAAVARRFIPADRVASLDSTPNASEVDLDPGGGGDVPVAAAAPGARLPSLWLVAAAGVAGAVMALLAVQSDELAWANPALAALGLLALAGIIALAVSRSRLAGPAAVALTLAFLGPLSVRTAMVAAFEHGDTPVEALVYTQTTPELKDINRQIARYARESGLGLDLPITVDATEAFTWPWAWYLRDYKRVSYPDLTTYQNNPSLIASLPPDGVLLAQLANAGVGAANPDVYGPGQRYKHRWWFPEDYRSTTTSRFFDWILDPAQRGMWARFFMHRTLPSALGSIDAVAYFPPGWTPEQAETTTQAAPEPRLESDGRLVTGEPGAGRGQFQRPAGVAVDAGGNIFVADSLNNRVQKLDPDGRVTAVLASPRGFREPWGVAVGGDGSVYVADTWNHRIQKFDRDLNFVTMWGQPPRQVGAEGADPLELYGPRAIAIDAAGNLLVTDTGHARVVKYSPEGRPLGSFGSSGTAAGQFQEPVAVAIAPNGDILVTDTWNGRIQRFDASFGYKGEFTVDGWASRGVENKPYLAFSPDGGLYVTVPDTGQVLRFGPDGRALGAAGDVGATNQPGRAIGVAVDTAGNVWVTDASGGRVVRFAPR